MNVVSFKKDRVRWGGEFDIIYYYYRNKWKYMFFWCCVLVGSSFGNGGILLIVKMIFLLFCKYGRRYLCRFSWVIGFMLIVFFRKLLFLVNMY